MSTTRRAFLQHSTAALAARPGLAVVPGLAAVPRLARAAASSGGAAALAAVADAHRPLPPGGVRLGGLLGQRRDECIRNGIGAQ
ncbi:MAG TPA: hypothetical protein VGB87_13795, partial [Vicinamibacteria bacterium]